MPKPEDWEMYQARGMVPMGIPWQSDSTKMFVYLSIFHPEMPLQERLRISHESIWGKTPQQHVGGRR